METVKVKFRFQCPKCGRRFEDRRGKEWMEFPRLCPTCQVPTQPELTTFPVKKEKES